MLTCSLEVDLQIPVTGSSSDNTDKCIKVRQKSDGVYEDKTVFVRQGSRGSLKSLKLDI